MACRPGETTLDLPQAQAGTTTDPTQHPSPGAASCRREPGLGIPAHRRVDRWFGPEGVSGHRVGDGSRHKPATCCSTWAIGPATFDSRSGIGTARSPDETESAASFTNTPMWHKATRYSAPTPLVARWLLGGCSYVAIRPGSTRYGVEPAHREANGGRGQNDT